MRAIVIKNTLEQFFELQNQLIPKTNVYLNVKSTPIITNILILYFPFYLFILSRTRILFLPNLIKI